jgi:hypothetical protein
MSCSTVKNDVFISFHCQQLSFFLLHFPHVRVHSSFFFSLFHRIHKRETRRRKKKKLKVELKKKRKELCSTWEKINRRDDDYHGKTHIDLIIFNVQQENNSKFVHLVSFTDIKISFLLSICGLFYLNFLSFFRLVKKKVMMMMMKKKKKEIHSSTHM